MLLRSVQAVVLALIVVAGSACRTTVPSGGVFDDFVGPAGARPDSRLWSYDIGAKWKGDSENPLSQTYTDSPANVRLDGSGHLVIQAVKSGGAFTSGRVVTRGKLDLMYGTLSARIKMPSIHGIRPAFWLLGTTEDWPRCGEIDVIEMPHRATHWSSTITGITTGGDVWRLDDKNESADLSTRFHTYWVTRKKDSITVGLDDQVHGSWTPKSLPPQDLWVFNVPMYAILNIAVTADQPPREPTPVQATMLVDWIRYTPG